MNIYRFLLLLTLFVFSSVAYAEEESQSPISNVEKDIPNNEAILLEAEKKLEATDPLAEMKYQYESGRYKQAYELGQDLLFDYEGEPDFDLLYGSSALEIGETHEAIFTFERLVEDQPANLRYRLELARAYYENGETEKAEDHFQQVLSAQQGLPDAVEQRVLGYLDAINTKGSPKDPTKQESFKGFVGLASGYDSNANAASETDIIRRYFGSEGNPAFIISSENQTEEESTAYLSYQAAGAYAKPLGELSVLDLKVYLSNRRHGSDLEFLDSRVAFFELGNRWRISDGILNLTLRYTGVSQNTEELYNLTNFRVSWVQALEWDFFDSYTLSASSGALRYASETNETRDINPTVFDISVRKQINQFVHQGGLLFGNDAAQGTKSYFDINGVEVSDVPSDHYSRDYQGFNYRLSYLHSPRVVYYGQVAYSVSKYKDVDHDITNNTGEWTKRDGDQSIVTLGTEYKWSPALSLRAHITTQQTASDIELYQYSRNALEVGAGYHF